MRRCLCANVDVTIDDDDVTFTEFRNYARAGHAHTVLHAHARAPILEYILVLVAMNLRADFKKQRNSVRSFS